MGAKRCFIREMDRLRVGFEKAKTAAVGRAVHDAGIAAAFRELADRRRDHISAAADEFVLPADDAAPGKEVAQAMNELGSRIQPERLGILVAATCAPSLESTLLTR